MEEKCFAVERLEKAEPLVDLLREFPGAHSLHSSQAESVLRGRWNIDTLRTVVNGIEDAILNEGLVLNSDTRESYTHAKEILINSQGAQDVGIYMNYYPELRRYQTQSA